MEQVGIKCRNEWGCRLRLSNFSGTVLIGHTSPRSGTCGLKRCYKSEALGNNFWENRFSNDADPYKPLKLQTRETLTSKNFRRACGNTSLPLVHLTL